MVPASTTTVPGGCAPARPVRSASDSSFDGRAYRIALPAGYDGTKAAPLLMLFHGFASSPAAIDADTGLEKLGATRGYVVVSPQGSGSPSSWSFVGPQATKDFAFVVGLTKFVLQTVCVDPAHVFAAGHSAGSAFTGFLVCRPPYLFAGAAMVEATIPSTCPANVAQSVLAVHGTADPVVLYNGGKGMGQTMSIPPVKQTIASLAKRAGCRAVAEDTRPASGVVLSEYPDCSAGRRVALLTIEGGTHPWAGGLQAKREERGVPGAQYSASTAILDFFDKVTSDTEVRSLTLWI